MPTHDDANKLFYRGIHALKQDRAHDALGFFVRALDLYRQVEGTEEKQADCMSGVASTLRILGRIPEAETLYRKSLSIYRENKGTVLGQAFLLVDLASILHVLDRDSEATRLYREALGLFTTVDNTAKEQAD